MRRITAALACLATSIAGPVAAERVAVRGPSIQADEPAPRRPLRPRPVPPRRSRVRKALAAARAHHLAAFRAYRKRGVFAHDLDGGGETYVWRDAEGHRDAVAALVASDGKAAAAQADALASALAHVRLLDLGDGAAFDWAMMSGFSIDEIDRLQRTHTRPEVVAEGDARWRADEDARLAHAYAAVDAYLVAHLDDGLDAATDALMIRSDLAWALVDPAHHARAITDAPAIPEPRRPPPRFRR